MRNADPRLVDQAIQWMIKLRFNVADDASTAAFERWLHSSAEHQQVWQRVATMNDDFNQLPAQLGRRTLSGARQRISRRESLKLLGLVAGAAGLAWFGRDYTPPPPLPPPCPSSTRTRTRTISCRVFSRSEPTSSRLPERTEARYQRDQGSSSETCLGT